MLLVLLLEFSELPVGEGEGLDLGDVGEDGTGDGLVAGVGLGEATLFSIEVPETGVEVGVVWVPGTVVGSVGGVEVVEGGLAGSGLGDPPPLLIVKVGEMLPELPITKLNATLANWEILHGKCMGSQAMMNESPSGYPEGTTTFTCPAVMGKPLASGLSNGEVASVECQGRRRRDILSCRLYPPLPSIHPKTTCPMGFVIWVGNSASQKKR